MALGLAVNATYFYAAAIELWTGRAERLFARWPLVILLAVHATLFAAGSTEALAETFPAMELVPLGSWFGLIHFESIIFSMGTAVFVVAFIRERGEAKQRTAAETDPLTGMGTRRAFLEQAEEALRHCQANDAPLSLVVFDLDRFKSINDRFGHPAGDAVLRRFGDTVRGILREDDRFGRLGGEEFALLLPGMSLGAAFAVAERVRAAFEIDCRSVEGKDIGGTVSGGVATAHPDSTVRSMLIAADEGLYEAKAKGRNRVERPPARISRDGKPFLNRVA
jgi:diguanylate cyclase (GGDEF)-like protein